MGLPSPPADEHHSRKGGVPSSLTKPSKISRSGSQRKNKRPTSGTASPHPHAHDHAHGSVDGRHKRVWKACERCRMKKTKCDGEVPCKRCQDDGQICITKVRKKLEYKQLPRGYAEVLENTQFTLIATIHKLYSMLREGKEWEMEEPDQNERGQPVVHDIAQKLGCIRPNSDIDLPVHSVFPEDEGDMRELANQLEEQQAAEHDSHKGFSKEAHSPKTDRDSSSELDLSDLDNNFQDYRTMAFGGENDSAPNLSPTHSYCAPDFGTLAQPRVNNRNSFPSPISPVVPDFSFMNSQTNQGFMPPSTTQPYVNANINSLPLNLDVQQGPALQSYSFENMFKPDNMIGDLSSADVMRGLSDPMMCGFEDDGTNAMGF